jgi:phage repressor protein C with HTH and peptisase S24 domain
MTDFPAGPAGDFARRLNLAMAERGFPERGRQAHWKHHFKVSAPTARAWLVGEHMPEDWRVREMAAKLAVDFEWLMFGGKPAAAGMAPAIKDAAQMTLRQVRDAAAEYLVQQGVDLRPIRSWDSEGDLPPDDYATLPRLEVRLSAGHAGPASHTEELSSGAAFRADYLRRKGWRPETHYTLRASGQSMEPTIQDGAPVVIAINEHTIRSGRIYALKLDPLDEPILKRLDRLPGARLRVRSDNLDPQFAAFEVAESAIQVIGRAVWTATEL